jgi:hypothetical protein
LDGGEYDHADDLSFLIPVSGDEFKSKRVLVTGGTGAPYYILYRWKSRRGGKEELDSGPYSRE